MKVSVRSTPIPARVSPDPIPGQARDIKVLAVLLFDQAPEFSRNFQATLDINSCRVISSQHTFACRESLVGGLKESVALMIGVAARLDPLPTTFDHPGPDNTPHSRCVNRLLAEDDRLLCACRLINLIAVNLRFLWNI